MLRIFSIPPLAEPDKKRRLIRLLVKIKPDPIVPWGIIIINYAKNWNASRGFLL
jgi:hypothetical protein